MSKRRKTWYADFETTQPNELGEVRCYLWVLTFENGRSVYNYDIESFINYIKDKTAIIYFHNLKFDSSYFMYYFIKHNIKFKVCEKSGVIYNIKFKNIEFRDSLNILPYTLKQIGETFCTRFHKLDYDDYAKPFDYVPNKYDITYCKWDTLTLKEGLENYLTELQKVLEENGATKTAKKIFSKLTNAGIAYEAFKEITHIEKYCERTTRELYNYLKPAYSGGYVYAKGGCYQEDDSTKIIMLDENSMYPDKYANWEMPIGKSFSLVDGDENRSDIFGIINITFTFLELKEGYLPIISQGFNKYGSTIYIDHIDSPYSITTTIHEFQMIKKFYKFDYYFNYGFGWNKKIHLFKKYADIFMSIKANSTGVRREVAKKLLNMCYGKTAMSGVSEIKEYYLNEEGVVCSRITGYENDDNELQYLQIAIAICSYAHIDLWNNMQKVGCENVLYTDTDSIKFLMHDEAILNELDLDDYRLGAWKVEGHPQIFKPLAPKKYIYLEDDRIHVTSAGFNHKEVFEALKCPIDEELFNKKGIVASMPLKIDEAMKYIDKFDFGLQVKSKQSKLVEGGRLISEIIKEIKEPRK